MIGSLLLSKQVNSLYDGADNGVSDVNIAAGKVVSAIDSLVLKIDKQTESIEKIYHEARTIENINDNIEIVKDTGVDKSDLELFLKQVSVAMAKSINPVEKQMMALADKLNTVVVGVGKTLEVVDSVKGSIHGEVLEIEEKMESTNKLLSEKFHEFTELLKKSNTEALVEVMKKVTEEFQKQMGELINKLVQENFDQLNKSVEQLNTWQKENREMIDALTKQYKQMADNFDATSTTLTKVGGDTKLLVSDGGKLRQIVDALNKIFIEDTKFIEISSKLADTATLTKDNMQKFDDSTKSLNDWVKKQRNFVDSVILLINKLDEINKINDYSEEFWKNTKKGLSDAVGSIRSSIDALNNEIGELDEHFYKRLNATLSELDTCMQAMIQGRR